MMKINNINLKELRKGMRIRTALLILGIFSMFLIGCSEIIAPEDAFPPDTPQNFVLLGGGDGQAHFRWEKNIEIDFKAYRLYRSINNITSFSLWVEIYQVEYVDRFLDYDSTYYYYLTAIDNAGNESLRTNIIDVQPLNISAPQPPSKVNVSGYNHPILGIQEVRISWVPPDIGDLKNYLVYRGADSSFIPDASSFIDSTNIAVYSDRLVQLNQEYFYKIIAVDLGLKTSLPSKAASDLVLSSPALISPANNTKFGTPRIFKWQSVTDAVDYVVYVGNGQFSDVIWSSGKIKLTEIPYTGPALQSGKVYYWWVSVYSKDKVRFEDGSEIPAQINSYSLVNSFFAE